jgi:hypothetical protein
LGLKSPFQDRDLGIGNEMWFNLHSEKLGSAVSAHGKLLIDAASWVGRCHMNHRIKKQALRLFFSVRSGARAIPGGSCPR